MKKSSRFLQAFRGVICLDGYDPSDMVQLLKALPICEARDKLPLVGGITDRYDTICWKVQMKIQKYL